MSSNRSRNAVLTLFLVSVLAAAGCTQTDVINPGVEILNVDLQLVNTETRFESAYFELRQVALRPVDPDADASLSADAIGALVTTMDASYRDTQTVHGEAALNEGIYQVQWIVLAAIAFSDQDPPISTDTCQEYITQFRQPGEIVIDELGGDVFVTVESGGENRLAITVDGQVLEAAFLDSWNCNSSWLCSPPAPWCLTTFRTADFVDQAPDFLDFESQ